MTAVPSTFEWVKVTTTLPKRPFPPPSQRPSIRTERLLLRPLALSDAEEYFVIRSQVKVMQWTVRGVVDEDVNVTKKVLEGLCGAEGTGKYVFAVCKADTGVMMGVMGIHTLKGILGWPEIGYLFRSEAWGKGYASEAAHGILQAWWALPREVCTVEVPKETVIGEGEVKSEVLSAVTASHNLGSRRVLTKAGFDMVKQFREWDEDLKKRKFPSVEDASKIPDEQEEVCAFILRGVS